MTIIQSIFDPAISVIAALILLAMYFNSLIFGSKLYFYEENANLFLLSGSQILVFTDGDIWTGLEFRLTSPESSKRKCLELVWSLYLRLVLAKLCAMFVLNIMTCYSF